MSVFLGPADNFFHFLLECRLILAPHNLVEYMKRGCIKRNHKGNIVIGKINLLQHQYLQEIRHWGQIA